MVLQRKTYFIRIVCFTDDTSIDINSFADVRYIQIRSASILHVENAENALLEVYSLLGSRLYAIDNFAVKPKLMSRFENGVYILKIKKKGIFDCKGFGSVR
jgi:hypothetical protein